MELNKELLAKAKEAKRKAISRIPITNIKKRHTENLYG